MNGRDGQKVRASLRHAEPGYKGKLHVNQTYPSGVPLQSMPPSLLMNLPPLPKELDYRIVGRDLALHDIVPNIVVDFVVRAFPSTEN
jgi:hypothetical protein